MFFESARLRAIQRVFCAIVMMSSLLCVPPILVSLGSADDTASGFLHSFLLSSVAGVLLWLPVRHVQYDLRLRDGFFIVTFIWVVASLVTALPFWLEVPGHSYADAVFEAVSGLTTTGATTLVGLDHMPRSILLFRAELNFVGGMGIVILAVAVLPMLKIGGMQLFRAETTGPQKDGKLTPRIADTAKALWSVYLALNIICALAYWAAGMNWFDAICHAMATLATGGFGNYDASFGYWDSALLDSIAIFFMLLGGISFGLHWFAWRRATTTNYFKDSEFRAYLIIAFTLSAIVAVTLYFSSAFASAGEALRHGTFQVVSNLTTTGFTTTGFVAWPGMLPLLLVLISFVGGSAGSTAGGMKVARVQMIFRQGMREVQQLVHPKGQFLVKVGGRRVSESVVIAVGGFCALYVLSYVVMTLLLTAFGVDIVTAFSAIAACINNLGPGLGEVASSFRSLPEGAVWICSFAMILGRLEVFTVLVLLTPHFWRD